MTDLLPEAFLREAVDLLVRLVEAAGAIVIFVGAAVAFARFLVVTVRRRGHDDFVAVRLFLGRFLALGLEFQLAGDVLRTAIAPSFPQIGQLAAIAAIRTALNFFLSREIEREGRTVRDSRPDRPAGPGND
ncbi:hypothetical protein Ppa06_09460 [Planomonospora parontospora subsp. parontospora]|uniref:DUF1622 domain-containing protein n=2 Tax=Planomonospora parontospora TaxID=58119 RepID=A0AA37BCF9_9ACTN|nr:DUF1622 domain-containing protein [Planomonospora parontospora]GGK50170.1 hypothetical protein GCM10010126_07150 [Planomonospora parontospora]GII07148.1 hypothetical protein Ppa06_09460 [Planomonospora parontospora subsp. parontospora]